MVIPKRTPPIVVVAFNRPRSLARLLNSLDMANYPSNDVLLIISIDKSSNNSEVLKVARDFVWQFGTKEIKNNETNLGLRKHVLQCGALSQKYESIIVLEDDLFVSANFYAFSIAALKFSDDKDYIGGISLYNHQLNVHNRESFNALEDGYDNWYFQFASSWGQVWSKSHWAKFIEWYTENQKVMHEINIPFNVSSWSEKSWLKFYVAYLIKENKYFFYPKVSLTTNFSDAGTHVGKDSTAYQVPLNRSRTNNFIFSEIQNSQSIYDAFFENKSLPTYLDISEENICIDLYGYRGKYDKRYVLSSKILNYNILKSFGKSLKPIEANIIEDIPGNDIFLYDTTAPCENSSEKNIHRKIIYNIKYISESDSKFMYWTLMKSRIQRKFQSVFKK